MGKIEDLGARRVAGIASRLRRELDRTGSVTERVDELDVDASSWRAGARLAARQLGRRVRTGVHPSEQLVWAVLTDWASEADQDHRVRAAAAAAASRPVS